jgi:hypothetical protein
MHNTAVREILKQNESIIHNTTVREIGNTWKTRLTVRILKKKLFQRKNS